MVTGSSTYTKSLRRGVKLLLSSITNDLERIVNGRLQDQRDSIFRISVTEVVGRSGAPRTWSEILNAKLNSGSANRCEEIHVSSSNCNLSAVVEACTEAMGFLPNAKRIRICTSAELSSVARERLLSLARIARSKNIGFHVTLLFDGSIETASQGGRRIGTTVEGVASLKHDGVGVSAETILTPANYYYADDILSACIQNNVSEWSFDLDESCSHFSAQERFHVAMFLMTLASHPSLSPTRQLHYQRLAIAIAQSNVELEKTAPAERGRSLSAVASRKTCARKDSLSSLDVLQHGKQLLVNWQTRRDLFRIVPRADSVRPATHDNPSQWKHVLITGWYGTETTGDKAILGEVLHFLKAQSPECRVTLTTIDQTVSRQTHEELPNLRGARYVDMAKGNDPSLVESVDAVIIGGGPLMEIQKMEYIRRMFVEANNQRKARVIFGCGVGPLYTERMRHITRDILRLATAGFFRDRESHEFAARLAPENTFSFACDPAVAFLHRWRNEHDGVVPRLNSSLRVAGLLRANTREFVAEKSNGEVAGLNAEAAKRMAAIIEVTFSQRPAEVNLLPMNSHALGGDDRLFNRIVGGAISGSLSVGIERRYRTLDEMIEAIRSHNVAIAMRYHGHVFCLALGIPFLSIDYTGRTGKVASLMKRIGYERWSEEWRGLESSRAANALQMLLDERDYWASYLLGQADLLVRELNAIYANVFHVTENTVEPYNAQNVSRDHLHASLPNP
jgi:polysaccharide pyruvyl transferase WcaK-like protein